MYLFQFTRFEQPRAHHQENQLYQYNIWYMSLCVGDHFVCKSESSFPTDKLVIYQESKQDARSTKYEILALGLTQVI
jgi:hypothetical protein